MSRRSIHSPASLSQFWWLPQTAKPIDCRSWNTNFSFSGESVRSVAPMAHLHRSPRVERHLRAAPNYLYCWLMDLGHQHRWHHGKWRDLDALHQLNRCQCSIRRPMWTHSHQTDSTAMNSSKALFDLFGCLTSPICDAFVPEIDDRDRCHFRLSIRIDDSRTTDSALGCGIVPHVSFECQMFEPMQSMSNRCTHTSTGRALWRSGPRCWYRRLR